MNTRKHNNWQATYDKLIEQGTSASTKRAYERDEEYFWAWVKQHLKRRKRYPTNVDTVIQFCLYHLDAKSPRPLKVSTLRRYLSTLSIAHQRRGKVSPTSHPSVKLLLNRTRAARQEHTTRKAAITAEVLEHLLNTCDESLSGVRDRALLLVGFFSGGRRRDELSQLQVNDLTPTQEGYLLTIRKSKNDKTAKGHTVPLSGEAATAVKAWLMKSGIREGQLFRGIKPNDTFYPRLSGNSINTMVKKRIGMIGLNPEEYGAHSLRAGFITSTTQQGMSLHEVMQYSGHRDIKTAQEYVRLPQLLP